MTADPLQPDMRILSEAWDAHVEKMNPESNPASEELQRSIADVERLLQVEMPPDDLKHSIWTTILEAAPANELETLVAPALTKVAANGHHPERAVPPATAMATPSRSRWIQVMSLYRLIAIGVIAGFIAGFTAGVTARLAMRVAGVLTVDQNRGMLTENENTVGEITLGGTLFIGFFAAAIGILGGVLYLAIRRWLPGEGWKRALGFGFGLLLVLGFIVMDQSNPDYHLFGPEWINVSTFSLVYVVFGFAVAMLADGIDRRVPALSSIESKWKRILLIVGMAPFVLIAMITFFAATLGSGLVGVAILLALVIGTIVGVSSGMLDRPAQWFQTRPAVGYALLLAPCLIGAVLTLRAIVTIMGGS